jgi:hypothetical protein
MMPYGPVLIPELGINMTEFNAITYADVSLIMYVDVSLIMYVDESSEAMKSPMCNFTLAVGVHVRHESHLSCAKFSFVFLHA